MSPGENPLFSGQIEATFDSYYCLHVLIITRNNLNFGKRTIRKGLILKNTLHIHVHLSGQPSNSNDYRCLSIDFDQFDIEEPSETHY